MTKQDAINIFGSIPKAAQALEVTRQAIHQWPDELSHGLVDRILGAAVRKGFPIPAPYRGRAA